MCIRPLRLGLIGGGINSSIGASHFIAAQMDGFFKVQAGCFSRDQHINTQTAMRWDVESHRTHQSWEVMLQKEKGQLDAIVVLTPTIHHRDPVISALRAGYPVICEKALAMSSHEAAEIEQVARDTGQMLAVTYNYTGYPMIRELRRMIREDRFGRLIQIHVEMPQEGFVRLNREGLPPKIQNWRLADGVIPTLSLDLGVHVHHLIDFLIDEKPLEVVASQSSLGCFRQVIDNTIMLVRYQNGIEGSIWFSKSALGHRNGLSVRIYGKEGAAEWCQMQPEFLSLFDSRGQEKRIDRGSAEVSLAQLPRYNRFKPGHPAGFLEAFANVYADIAQYLGKDIGCRERTENYLFSAVHAHEGLVMLEAVNRSAHERRWIDINFRT